MVSFRKPRVNVVALLGWFTYVLLLPVQAAGSTNMPAAVVNGHLSAATGVTEMPVGMAHMAMGTLSPSACIQLQCHAAPAVASVASEHHIQPPPTFVAVAVVAPEWVDTPVSTPVPFSLSLRSEPIVPLRSARLLI